MSNVIDAPSAVAGHEVPPTTGRRERRGGVRPRRVFWAAFALLMTLTTAWSFASPLATGPDENAHMVKAAAVVRGQLSGTSAPDNPGAGTVTVPALFGFLMGYPACVAFQGEQPATCLPALPSGEAASSPVETSTWVVRNNPVYYAVVGLPSLVGTLGAGTLFAMRLVSAALCSLVLAWGFRALAELPRRSMAVLAAVAAVTPMVIYLNSTVNPSALEISAAFSLWVSLLALVRAPDPSRLNTRMAGIAVVAVLLAHSRGLSPLYMGVIVLIAAVAGPWANVVAVLRDRRSWPWLGGIAVATGLSLAWSLNAGTLEAGGSTHDELGFLSTANRTLLDTGDYLVAAIGRFGWNDTELPMLGYILYFALLGLPLLLALALGNRRDRLVTAAATAVAVGLPVALHAWQAHNVGYIWTARYSMPLFVGVLVVAGVTCRSAWDAFPRWSEARLLRLVVAALCAGMLIAFLTNVRRYATGTEGSWREAFTTSWDLPVPTAVLALVVVAVLAAIAVLVPRWCANDTAGPASPARSEPVSASDPVAPRPSARTEVS